MLPSQNLRPGGGLLRSARQEARGTI